MGYRLSGTATSRTSYICINSISNKFKIKQFKIAGEAENNSPPGFAACLSKSSKFLIQNSDGSLPSYTIFAFLTLNTPRSAHEEIFGAKFSSFERLALYH